MVWAVGHDFEASLAEIGRVDGHADLRVDFPPKVAISKLVNRLKVSPFGASFTSSLCKTRLERPVGSPSYFAASRGGAGHHRPIH
jgi:putative transposase